jgi:NADPH:quinone reductase-like Zn-dependent oxidoreductase
MSLRIAYRLSGPGGIDAFERIETPIPDPEPGWVVIEVKAFGLNRSELFSRKGLSSPDFSFPRVLGLECVGVVHDRGDTDLDAGDTVMALMGGMGRSYDGSYATYAAVPRRQVFRVDTRLDWPEFGAIPETYNTAWGVVIEDMRLNGEERVLIRGGTSALGMACASIAKALGCEVAGTTRNPKKRSALAASGVVDHVILDEPGFVDRVREQFGPVTAVVECVGSKATIETSCATMPDGGKLGMVGQLAEAWEEPTEPDIPRNVTSTFTRSDLVAWPRDQDRMTEIVAWADAGRIRPNIHRVFGFDELPEAHRVMEFNEAVGKLVVVTG